MDCLGDAESLDGANLGIGCSNKAGDEGERGDGRLEMSCSFTPGRRTAVSGGVAVEDGRLEDSYAESRPGVGACRDGVREASGGGIFTGSGNNGPLFFLRLGRRKMVVVVETVCVVVVVA